MRPGFGSVAACDEEEAADLLALDRLYHLAGYAHYRLVPEAGHYGLAVFVFGEARHSERLLDQGGEIPALEVLDARPAHGAARKDIVLICLLHAHQAVSGEQDRAGELREFLHLVLPCSPEVAVEMGVLLQFGITVGGEHLAVGIDVDAFALALLEHLFEVIQVVAGDEDRMAFLRAERHARRHRVSVDARIGSVEDFHGPQVNLAAFEYEADPFVDSHRRVVARDRCKRLMDERGDRIVLLTKYRRMLGVGGYPFKAEQERMLERPDVAVARRPGHQPQVLALLHHLGFCRCGFQGRAAFGEIRLSARRCDLPAEPVPQMDGLAHVIDEPSRVVVDVGKRRKKRVEGEYVDVVIYNAYFSAFHGKQGQALQRLDEQVLEAGYLMGFAAHAHHRASFTLGGLLTLVTKHIFPLSLNFHELSIVIVNIAVLKDLDAGQGFA